MSFLNRMRWTSKSVDSDIAEFVDRLKLHGSDQLVSVILYGSRAKGEVHSDQSDVNLLLVVNQSSAIEKLKPAVSAWLKQGYRAPVMLLEKEVAELDAAFPIEHQDLLQNHRVLFGKSVICPKDFNPEYVQYQALHELMVLLIRLRQLIAAEGMDSKPVRQLTQQSLHSAEVLFRAVLRLKGVTGNLSKVEATQKLAQQLDHPLPFLERWESPQPGMDVNVFEKDLAVYLKFIEKVVQQLSAPQSK